MPEEPEETNGGAGASQNDAGTAARSQDRPRGLPQRSSILKVECGPKRAHLQLAQTFARSLTNSPRQRRKSPNISGGGGHTNTAVTPGLAVETLAIPTIAIPNGQPWCRLCKPQSDQDLGEG